MSTNSIRILSFNCWGLKYVAKNRRERIRAISEQLATSDYHLIGLQELWVYADYELLRAKLCKRLPFAKFFYSGALGAGLALFSRYPIVAASIHPYSLNGSPLDVAGGDWFVGKSAASIVILHPVLGEVEVYNTHLYARGGEEGSEAKRAHRLVNAWEFAKLTQRSAELGRYVISMGDFNSVPTTLPMTLIREHASLTDAWEQSHEALPQARSVTSTHDIPSPQEAIRDYGVTADSPINSYSASKPLDSVARKYQGKRLDYVLFRHPVHRRLSSGHAYILKATDSKVVMTGRVPGYDFSYSDHFGLDVTLQIEQADHTSHDIEAGTSRPPPPSLQLDTRLSDAALMTTLQALMACYRSSRSRSRMQLIVFAACVCIVVVVVIASAWLPSSWINPIFLLFTVVVTWLGTTMLYSGFIYGSWEVNALTNVIEELELLRQQGTRMGASINDSAP